MEFTGNAYNGEKQIRDLLMQRQKFTEGVADETFRKKCQDRLFTQKEMRWSDVKERAATNPAWQWHTPSALDSLKNEMLKKGIWREHGGYIEKPPFPKEKTGVFIQELKRDDLTGEVTLKIVPQYGETVYYEIGAPATTASDIVENLHEFKTKELKLWFLCVDSTGEHETGAPVEWTNKIVLKYRVFDHDNNKVVKLKSYPAVPIRYTTDGSNPKEYGILYDGEFTVPEDAAYVLAVAEEAGLYSEVLQIKIDRTGGQSINIDPEKPLKLCRSFVTKDTAETYRELDLLKKYHARLSDLSLTFYQKGQCRSNDSLIQLVIDFQTKAAIEKIENTMDNIRNNFFQEGSINISLEYGLVSFPTGREFLDWTAEKKKVLKDFKQEEIVQ